MPYIKSLSRYLLSTGLGPITAGELNYVITLALIQKADRPHFERLIDNYISTLARPLNYQRINDVLGAILGAVAEYRRRTGKMPPDFLTEVFEEFYARVAAPYEDQKIIENGDVYSMESTGIPYHVDPTGKFI
jgi:hypothetical protein